ncbi:MAG: hypothetical protein FWD64_03945 [Acidobacteriaceae bacterium]|nr:hypothetical protein [Acidobacteriaceae bacterium]
MSSPSAKAPDDAPEAVQASAAVPEDGARVPPGTAPDTAECIYRIAAITTGFALLMTAL